MPVEIDHPSLIKVNPDNTIYRYLTLEKLEYLLRDCALYFRRCDGNPDDIFEGSVPQAEVRNRELEIKRVASFFNNPISDNEAKQKSNNIGNLQEKLTKSFVVNCWHINDGESDAMWRLYLKKEPGVAIKSTVKNLIDSLNDTNEQIYLRKINYINYDSDIYSTSRPKPYDVLTPCLTKRSEFAHENELRLILHIPEAVKDSNYWNNSNPLDGKNILCDINGLVDKIILCPGSDNTTVENVKSLLVKYNFDKILEKSKLDKRPTY